MNETELDIKLHDATGQLFEFQGIRSFYEFLKKEQEFWTEKAILVDTEGSTKGKQNKHPFFASSRQLQPIVQLIDGWFPQIDSWASEICND